MKWLGYTRKSKANQGIDKLTAGACVRPGQEIGGDEEGELEVDFKRLGSGCSVSHEKPLSSNDAIAGSRNPMTSRPEMRVDGGVNGQKSLRLPEGLESAHAPLAFSCRLPRRSRSKR